jgi:AbrB family transcriptional regulator, stage V sporulation protein T
MSYLSKISASGKISLPAALRRELDLHPGDSVVIERQGDHHVIKSYMQVVAEIQDNFRALIKEPFTVDEFIAERRAEAARE